MGDFILLVNCYLYGIIIIMLAVLLLLVYVRGQISHTFTNPFEHKDNTNAPIWQMVLSLVRGLV